jgi:hypothetical protein
VHTENLFLAGYHFLSDGDTCQLLPLALRWPAMPPGSERACAKSLTGTPTGCQEATQCHVATHPPPLMHLSLHPCKGPHKMLPHPRLLNWDTDRKIFTQEDIFSESGSHTNGTRAACFLPHHGDFLPWPPLCRVAGLLSGGSGGLNGG